MHLKSLIRYCELNYDLKKISVKKENKQTASEHGIVIPTVFHTYFNRLTKKMRYKTFI